MIKSRILIPWSLFLSLFLTSTVQAQIVQLWNKQFGDVSDQWGYSVAVDPSGNVVMTGYFNGTVDFGGDTLASAGEIDIFLAKFDLHGNHLWSQRFGDASNQYGWSVAFDPSGNAIMTGHFYGTVDFGGGPLTSAGSSDIFLAKFDANGTHLWSQRFGDSSIQYGHSVAFDPSGNVVMTGYFTRTVDFGGGPLSRTRGWDIFLAKFDPNGTHLWSQGFENANEPKSMSVACDPSGSVVISGEFDGTVDFGGGPLTSPTYPIWIEIFSAKLDYSEEEDEFHEDPVENWDIFLAKFDPNGNHLWSQRFGDAGYQQGRSVAFDPSGNVVMTGDFEGMVDFGGSPLTSAGRWDIFLAKFNPSGTHLWSKRFGDTSSQFGNSVAFDPSGNVVMTGYFNRTLYFGGAPLTSAGGLDIFLAKFDPNGTHLWSKRFGDSSPQSVHSVAFDPSGNVVITGWFEGTVDFGGGPLTSAGRWDIFLAKFNPSGTHLWSKRFGNADFQEGFSVAFDPSGNVAITGCFRGIVDFGGGPLTSAGGFDIFLAKFDPHGTHLWSKRFGDSSPQSGHSVAFDPSGNVVMTGYFNRTVDFGGGPLTSSGGLDIFLAKFDPNGTHLWSKRFGDADFQEGFSVAFDPSGNVVIIGCFRGTVDFGGGPLTSAGGRDISLAKFDGNGTHLWSQRFGDASDQYGNSIVFDLSGNVVMTGYYVGTVDFGGGPLTSAGSSDIFLAKFDANGNHLWSQRFGDSYAQYGKSVAVDPSGNVIMTGAFRGTVYFGSSPLISAGGSDIFLAKFGVSVGPVTKERVLYIPFRGR